jgi:hypothetical protein
MKISVENWWNDTDRGNRSTGRKTCPSATLYTTNHTWTYLAPNPGLRGDKPATDRLTKTETKINVNYIHIDIQSVPPSKHTPSRLYENTTGCQTLNSTAKSIFQET